MEGNTNPFPTMLSRIPAPTPDAYNKKPEQCDYYTTLKYLNFTGRVITIVERSGLVIPIPPREDPGRTGFYVRREVWMHRRILESVRNHIVSNNGIKSEEYEAIERDFLKNYSYKENGFLSKMDYEFTLQEITVNEGSIYVTELDIILTRKEDNIPPHPFSRQALVTYPGEGGQKKTSIFRVVIVDNKETIGPRWMRLVGKVVKVDTITDPLKEDGVYITHAGHMPQANVLPSDSYSHIPKKEIDAVPWLHKTFHEADHSPEADVQNALEMKREEKGLKKLEVELRMQTNETQRIKSESERATAILNQELAESERKRREAEISMQKRYDELEHQSKIRQMQTKDHYEEKSYTRKDTSELVKFVPSLLIGAVTAFVAIRTIGK